MNSREYLTGRWGSTYYSVPPESADRFLELQGRADRVFQEHALRWSLLRSRGDPTHWHQFGPVFRERAALERAAAALDREGDILKQLSAFEVDLFSTARSAIEGTARTIEVDVIIAVEYDETQTFERHEYEPVFEVGGGLSARFSPESLPIIDPGEMSPAMRLAQSLASALAPRLNAAVPPGYSVAAHQEVFFIRDEQGRRTGLGNVVDRGIEEAILGLLEELQETLTEDLTTPWPHDPEQGYVFHEPKVAIRDGEIHFWYGSKLRPVLAFEPIRLSEIDT
jgi:hypothetical protein